MNKKRYQRKSRKEIRKSFEKRCVQLSKRASSIGLRLHWSRPTDQPRSTTLFSLWAENEFTIPIVKGLYIDQMKNYIDRYHNLKAFL